MDIDINEQIADIRLGTRTLKQLSKGRVKRRRGTHLGAKLLLEPGCPELPSAVLEDTVLQPVDKIVLLIVMTIARQSPGDAFLPTQAELARMANVASPDTVWRALSILRCSRWLTACQKKWCQGGRFEPSAYVANAKPLPIADTLFLDPHYVEFLNKSAGHAHGRVRKVACEVLAQLSEETRNREVEQPTLFGAKI